MFVVWTYLTCSSLNFLVHRKGTTLVKKKLLWLIDIYVLYTISRKKKK